MQMRMSLTMNQVQVLKQQQLLISLPQMNWSLVKAFEDDAEHGFILPLTLKRYKLEGLDALTHEERMKRIDEFNKVFRFAYTRGQDEETGKEKFFYKIPLLRNRNIDPADIKIRISRAEYVRATAILKNVGMMERIARAVPYHELYTVVKRHLAKEYKISLKETAIVGVDRGGRLPAIILSYALDCDVTDFLKVDQGRRQLDEERLEEFSATGKLRGKHVLFVDSTVDSGRQIEVLRHYFDNSEWQEKLGHRSWSIVGSNEDGECLYKHLNINWGVDPDQTFEDDPRLMGVDYAPGSNVKVVEVPSKISMKIRQVLLDVPRGYVFDFSDIEEQMREAEAELKAREKMERDWERITSSELWQDIVAQRTTYSPLGCLSKPSVSAPSKRLNILVIGRGRKKDCPDKVAEFIADTLGSYYSFLAGTPDGNPGTVLNAVLKRAVAPKVRLYQPEYRRAKKTNNSFGGTPIVFVGPGKENMRQQMIKDSDIVLALGGAEGTLREVLLALGLGKPVVLIWGWGPIPSYFSRSGKKLSKSPNLIICLGIAEAVQTILNMTKV